MGKFFTISLAVFVSVLGALATWYYVEKYLNTIESQKLNAQVEAIASAEKEIVKEITYVWKVEEKTNAVTGEQVATATRFSEDIGSAVTFRCYGLKNKRFDVLVSFPEPIDWNNYKGSFYAEMKFRLDKKSLSAIKVDRSSSSVAAVTDLKEKKNIEQEYKKYPSLLEIYSKENAGIKSFKSIANAELFEASIPDGTIFQQVISINLQGIQDALKPVLSLCEKEGL